MQKFSKFKCVCPFCVLKKKSANFDNFFCFCFVSPDTTGEILQSSIVYNLAPADGERGVCLQPGEKGFLLFVPQQLFIVEVMTNMDIWSPKTFTQFYPGHDQDRQLQSKLFQWALHTTNSLNSYKWRHLANRYLIHITSI